MSNTVDTIGKMGTATAGGIILSFSELESALRIISLGLTITFSVIVFVRNHRQYKKKHPSNEEENN